MSTSNFKKAFALLVAIGMFGTGWSVFRSEAVPQDKPVEKPKPDTKDKPVEKVNPEPKTPPKEGRLKEESINLPKTQAPTQVLASIDKDGKLVVKMAVMVFIPPKQPNPPPGIGGAPMFPARIVVGPPGVMMPFAPGGFGGFGGPGGGNFGGGKLVWEYQPQTYDLKEVEVLDTKGKTIDAAEVAKLLKEETVALASMPGQKVDPLHLRLVKEGTLVFNLPMPQPMVGFPGFGFPQPPLPPAFPKPPVLPKPPAFPQPPVLPKPPAFPKGFPQPQPCPVPPADQPPPPASR